MLRTGGDLVTDESSLDNQRTTDRRETVESCDYVPRTDSVGKN